MSDDYRKLEHDLAFGEWDDIDEGDPEPETCILCSCIIGEEVGVGLRNPDGSGRVWCDLCYKTERDPA
jgi:hypothetical protein